MGKDSEMSKPVAWMKTLPDGTVYGFGQTKTSDEFDIPLYTHPVKELTDEVIEQVRVAIMGAAYWCADENMPEAYNAVKVCCGQVLGILVKAQEK
tara:strand:- start:221 stop:505 length:285 start_codon:yes stop_codon:yes gene_type:complete